MGPPEGLAVGDEGTVRRRLGEDQHLVVGPGVRVEHRLEWRSRAAPHEELELLVAGVRLPEELAPLRPEVDGPRQPRVAGGARDQRAEPVAPRNAVEHRPGDRFLRRDPCLGLRIVEPLHPGVRVGVPAAMDRDAALGIASCRRVLEDPGWYGHVRVRELHARADGDLP
jgi:hypothetical protein